MCDTKDNILTAILSGWINILEKYLQSFLLGVSVEFSAGWDILYSVN